jgi:hypothetical protein
MPATTPARNLSSLAEALFAEIERLLPRYRAVPEDARVNEGNVAVVLIGEAPWRATDQLRARAFNCS